MKALPLSIGKYRAVGSVGVKSGKRFGSIIKVAIFLLIAVMVFGVLNFIAQPVWISWNNYDTTHGFYEEPENTIETIFLGSSVTVNGIIPTELYEEYGICSYNFGTEQQPMLASYYWMEEAYRLHSETLDTVVLDVSMLRKTPEEAYYRKALDNMKLSNVKLRAVQDYSALFEQEAFINLFPLLAYHDRWKELTEDDFTRREADTATRGYQFVTTRLIDTVDSYTSIALPSGTVEEDAEELELNEESLSYLDRMVSFCKEHEIRLVLVKAPTTGWSSSAHIAVQGVADQYGLDFLDFNYEPYFSELDFNYSCDSADGGHMNYYGASKYTSWLGSYLIEECANRDVRGSEEYSFLEKELAAYKRKITKVALDDLTDPGEYLSYLTEQGDYAIFISVKDEATGSLTQEQKGSFAGLGLEKLSALGWRASYLAVIDGGEITEYTQENTGQQEDGTICCAGNLADGTRYEMISGGYETGNLSSILLDGTEYSAHARGLNIVVYDKENATVIDTASFDTCASAERDTQDYAERLANIKESKKAISELSGTDRKLYLYERACEQKKLADSVGNAEGENGLLAYLKAFWNIEDCEIYLSAKGDAAGALTEEGRHALEELGLSKLAGLNSGESYLAVIGEGNVLMEESSLDTEPLKASTAAYTLISGGSNAGDCSSILIDGTEYSNAQQGLNIVVYDTVTGRVVDQITFDTGTAEQTLEG